MALEEYLPSVHIEPSDVMKSLFRRTVMAAYGRDSVDGKLTVIVDRYGFSANQEIIQAGQTPGQRVAVDRWVNLSTDGTLSKHEEAEPLNIRLAREIRSKGPEPSRFDRDVQAFLSVGLSDEEAFNAAIDLLFSCPGITEACKMLVRCLDVMTEEADLGLNDVDAFELADTINRVRDNFNLPTIQY